MFKESLLIEKLQQANLFDHEVENFNLKETHLSWVILTGKYAYKIKKPVDFGFVNFTTLEKRKHYCALELELNNRLTDSVYIDVLPIFGTEESPSFDSNNGSAIEYAIKMHQFEQENIFDVLQENKKVTIDHIKSLASQIATFHSNAKVIVQDSELGGYNSVSDSTIGNFNAFDTFDIAEEERSQLNEIYNWTRAQIESNKELFEQRKSSGFVRHCHGDIHLGNIALVNNEPVIFDCIDFNEGFYWIDTINEIAFLAMDLMLREEKELAINFLNAYFEKTNDYEGISLLKFYLIYRALVRAKVAMYTDPVSLYPTFKKYVTLASDILASHNSDIFITFGVSGCGKSTYAQEYSVNNNAIIVRSDIERNFLCDGKMSYEQNITDKVYKNLIDKAEVITKSGFNVILDATYLKKSQRSDVQSFAKANNCNLIILKITSDLDTIKSRIKSRTNDISEATVDVVTSQINSIEPLDEEEQELCIEINS